MRTPANPRKVRVFAWLILCLAIWVPPAAGQQAEEASRTADQALGVERIVMCEEIREYAPVKPAIVFSLAIGKVHCFTSFNPVPRKMTIYHSWYRRDRLITNRRLTLEPPEWATFSTIQLREADKGPWRVEIRDQDNHLLGITRFSITD